LRSVLRILPCLLVAGSSAAALLLSDSARAASDEGLQREWSWKWKREGLGDLRVGDEGIRVRSPERNFQLDIGGRLHLDFGAIDDDATTMDDEFELRRARVSFAARAYDDWRAKVDFDAAAEKDERLRSLWVGYYGFKRTRIRAGVISHKMGLDGATSSNDVTFMERSLAFVQSSSSMTGGEIQTYGKRWSARLGGFFEPFGDDERDKHRAEGPLVSGRLTFAPVREDDLLLHFGASAFYRDITGDNRYRLRTRPESRLADRILNTGLLTDVDDVVTFGGEAAFVWGPVSVQGEYLRTELWRSGGFSDASFDGGYVQGSWFLTGESRPYSRRRGGFRRIDPERAWGAVELALRWSTIDLTDSGVAGGESDDVTLGLNWYLNHYSRLMFNYVYVNAERTGDLASDEPHIFQVRFQLAF
jgi:phosphate-selective porin OprO/OprP